MTDAGRHGREEAERQEAGRTLDALRKPNTFANSSLAHAAQRAADHFSGKDAIGEAEDGSTDRSSYGAAASAAFSASPPSPASRSISTSLTSTVDTPLRSAGCEHAVEMMTLKVETRYARCPTGSSDS